MIFLLQPVDAIAKPFQEHGDTVIFTPCKYSAAANPGVPKKKSGIAQHFFPYPFEHETFLKECEVTTKQSNKSPPTQPNLR